MQGERLYRITYTWSAVKDMGDKVDYFIFEYNDSELAEIWYKRLRDFLQVNLSSFPYKYPVFEKVHIVEPIIRYLTFRNDIIFYYVDENNLRVVVLAVCTKGQELEKHINKVLES